MKLEYGMNACRVFFEKDDKFAGKELHVSGERDISGLWFNRQSLDWVIWSDEHNMPERIPVEEDVKDELIAYIVAEGKKQDYSFILW